MHVDLSFTFLFSVGKPVRYRAMFDIRSDHLKSKLKHTADNEIAMWYKVIEFRLEISYTPKLQLRTVRRKPLF